MDAHYHVNVETVVITTAMALIGFNLIRFTAAAAVKSSNPLLQHVGKAAGGLINFGG